MDPSEMRDFYPREKKVDVDRMTRRDISIAFERSGSCPDGNCSISQAIDQMIENDWTDWR